VTGSSSVSANSIVCSCFATAHLRKFQAKSTPTETRASNRLTPDDFGHGVFLSQVKSADARLEQ
jgi:hypothetical protein